jgi:aspartate aminotransferase
MAVTATVDRLRREGIEVIDFGAGEPDCATPEAIKAAALAGLQEPVRLMLDEYRARRDALYDWVSAEPQLGCRKPAGAFYMFIDVSQALSIEGLRTSTQFAQALLDEQRVAVTPGEAFDAPGFIRLSYATSMDRLREGSRRLVSFVRDHAPTRAAAV